MSGFTFESEMRTAQYATRVQAALLNGLLPETVLTPTCPECGEDAKDSEFDHILMVDREDTMFVLIGCEGYWVIDPALVGMPSTTWQANALGDEMTGVHPEAGSGYPVCPGAPADEPHYLCFMERRDLDECPECGHAIPDDLKLNDDMTGPRVTDDLCMCGRTDVHRH